MRLRFSVGDAFAYDAHGRPTFSVVGEPSAELRNFLEGCDVMLRQQLGSRGGPATWRRTVIQKVGARPAADGRGRLPHFVSGAQFLTPEAKTSVYHHLVSTFSSMLSRRACCSRPLVAA